jgi:1-acyl-sn-glycerol-3-phosphate acyltransferase
MLRPCLRLGAIVGVSLAFLLPACVARSLALLGRREASWRAAAATQRAWARALLALLGVEVECEGAPPPGAHLVVANHLSYLDILVLAAHFPGRFVAKREIAGWPVLGLVARLVGTLFVAQRRTREIVRVGEEMARTLAAGVPVILFPEGRSTRGAEVERLHSSLLECGARARIPCLAVALGYETPRDPWAPAATVCWWGGMGFWRHAWRLASLAQVRARVRPAAETRRGGDRKDLCARLRADLVHGFVPVAQAPIPPDYPWPELFAEPARAGG